MTGLSNILPFLEYARTLKVTTMTVKNQDLFLTKSLVSKMSYIGEIPASYKMNLGVKIPTVYHVYPLGMLIMKGTDYDICAYKRSYEHILCNVISVDYTSVACMIEIEYNQDRVIARFPHLNGYLEEEISDTALIDYAVSGDALFKPEFGFGRSSLFSTDAHAVAPTASVKPLLEWEDTSDKLSKIDEAVSLADFSSVSTFDAMNVSGSKTPQTIKLESYFTGGYVTNRTPLLVGPSAVAKSAMVKALTKKYGMRLVDVRLAFTSRLDIEGLTGRLEKNGIIMSEASPASFMLECSDAYIDFCKEALIVLTKAQDEESDDEKKKIYQESIDKFREGSKIPVLFLDEVTRAPSSVRQAFTKILSDKQFMGYPMTYARVVAATNVALGAPEELQGIYQTQDAGDAAFYDRFESIQIYPDDVRSDWTTWGNETREDGRRNIHPLVLEALHDRPDQAYNFNYLYDVYQETQNEDDVTASPYPNYRTWELVSNYLYAQEDTKVYMTKVISGLVGVDAGNYLIGVLIANGWTEKPDSDDTLSDVITQGMDTGVPVMMITPSSIGKTARIKSVAKERNALLIDINLAEQDRVDLLGPPVRVPVERFVSASISTLPQDIQETIKKAVSKYDLPSHVTIKAPKEDIVTKLREASAQGREVIVHFDELNRVQNPSVMSSVFECISDHRVLGVQFDPANVRVFASCNMGENYSDAQSLDPAFSARFVMYKRSSYEESDVKAFISYMEKKKFSPVILNFFKSRSTEDIIRILSSVETRSLELSSASTRAWEDLDKFLKDDVNQNVCKGTIFFTDSAEARAYEKFMRSAVTKESFESVTSIVDSKLGKWSAIGSGIRIPIKTSSGGSEIVTAEDLATLYRDARDKVSKELESGYVTSETSKIFANILLYMFSMNREVASTRGKIFKMALGSHSEVFGDYYNTVSGIEETDYSISDCTDIDKFHKYVQQEIRGVTMPNEISKVLVGVTTKFAEEFPSASRERSRDVLNYSISCINTSEAVGEYLRSIVTSASVEGLIASAEAGDVNFSVMLLKRAGINVNAEKVESAKKIVRSPRIK